MIGKGIMLSAVLCLLIIGCGTAPEIVRVNLDYTPTNLAPPPKDLGGASSIFLIFADKRKILDQIGENKEKKKIVPIKTSPEGVTAFIDKAFRKEFVKAGFNVVDNQDSAQKIIRITLLNLWAEESNIYEANVAAGLEIQDKTGAVLAGNNFMGVGKRWGRSYSEDEYRKVLSDAVVDLVKNMFRDAAFVKSMG